MAMPLKCRNRSPGSCGRASATCPAKKCLRRQQSMTKEEVLSQVNYHPELTTANVVCHNGTLYIITRIDTFEGKEKLTL